MASDFLDIVINDNATFDYKPAPNATLKLRIVPDEVEARLRKDNRTEEWKRGQRLVDMDASGYISDVVDYAIVDWSGVRAWDPQAGTATEVTCTRHNKGLIPEWVKAEVVRMCLGKEAGQQEREQGKKS